MKLYEKEVRHGSLRGVETKLREYLLPKSKRGAAVQWLGRNHVVIFIARREVSVAEIF
jgi:hypothetical protein